MDYLEVIAQDNISLGQDSISLGHDNSSFGQENISLGQDSISLGQDSFSLGRGNISQGQYNISLGQDCISLRQDNIPFGQDNISFRQFTRQHNRVDEQLLESNHITNLTGDTSHRWEAFSEICQSHFADHSVIAILNETNASNTLNFSNCWTTSEKHCQAQTPVKMSNFETVQQEAFSKSLFRTRVINDIITTGTNTTAQSYTQCEHVQRADLGGAAKIIPKPCGKATPEFPWRHKRHGKMIISLFIFYLVFFVSIFVYGSQLGLHDTQSLTIQNSTSDSGSRVKRFAVNVKPKVKLNRTVHCISVVNQSHGLPSDFLSRKFAERGGWLIHLMIGTYMFAAVASVCDIYFVPALEHISEDLDLQSDVAGATFMAAASSAPELCTSIIGVFLAKNDVGLGTVLGSSIFNLLVIIGACAIFAGMPVQLTWYPLTRDTIFYAMAVIQIGFFLEDSLITWHEAVTMVLTYIMFIVTMVFNKRLERWCLYQIKVHQFVEASTTDSLESARKRLSMMEARRHSRIASHDGRYTITKSGLREVERLGLNPDDFKDCSRGVSLTELGMRLLEEMRKSLMPVSVGTSADPLNDPQPETVNETPPEKVIHVEEEYSVSQVKVKEKRSHAEEDGPVFHKKDKVVVSDYKNPLTFPKTFCARCYWLFILPLTILHAHTIPDSRRSGTWHARAYLLSFALSVLYIGFYSYIMVWMISLAGDVWRIPNTITGLTVIAAGTSVPDLLASVFVARDGYGDMAVSNAVGSNVFDILVCLGIPWLIDSTFINKGGTPINSEGMVFATLTLILTIFYLWGSMKCFDWTLTPIYGIVTILVYIAVTVFCILIETNMIFQMHEHRYC
ncbi:hypothetical protein Btru_051430 [Bulinus truncatus]|nr:hypothetical protein Btru_051430 [Bulinus truncatus]